jgi:hypothetical protein
VEFVKHLWLEHRLVLDGHEVREPWQLIEEWGHEYSRSGDPELLARCRALADRLDADQGRLRVERSLLAHGVKEEGARQALLVEAGRRRVSLCPRCFTFVDGPEEIPAQPLSAYGSRLSNDGYQIEIDDKGIFSRLVLQTPGQSIYRGGEPGQIFTFAAAAFFLAGPFILAALLLAVLPVIPPLSAREGWVGVTSPLAPVIFLLLCALAAFFWARWKWPTKDQWLDRAIDYAWTITVPRLEAKGYTTEDFAFVASLALTSVGRGQPVLRAVNLDRLVNNAEKAVAAGTVPVTHLAALWRLALEDKARMGEDIVPLTVAQAGRSFSGDLPLSFAEILLSPISQTSEVLKTSEVSVSKVLGPEWKNRLRILLCERAFEAGFEVRDLTELAKLAPFLSHAVQAGDIHGMAGLRLLWSLRPRKPWDQLGPVETAFELAAGPGKQNVFLEECPDLLLAAADGSPLILCSRGVIFQGALFSRPPRSIEAIRKALFRGFELVIDDRRFHYSQDSDAIVQKVECWFRYYFGDWVQQVKDVCDWRSPGLPPNLRLRKTFTCPGCGREVSPRIGDFALLREETQEPWIARRQQVTDGP